MGFLQNDSGPKGGKIFILQCDFCSKIFSRNHKTKFIESKEHFCSVSCSAKHRNAKLKANGIDPSEKARLTLANKVKDNIIFAKTRTQKAKNTVQKKYNVDNISQLESVKKKKEITSIEKYGTRHPMQTEDVKTKLFDTLKRNSSYKRISKIENKVKELLIEIYGKENIATQEPVNNWFIDFYIKPLQLYLQVDGVYWHGLLSNSCKPKGLRLKSIQRTIKKDQEQNEWFKKENLQLVRLTDLELKEAIKNNLIYEKLKSL